MVSMTEPLDSSSFLEEMHREDRNASVRLMSLMSFDFVKQHFGNTPASVMYLYQSNPAI